jgi:superfamily II DNA or RNA helicase
VKPKTLRLYQQEAVTAILKCWKSNHSCIAAMATGGGKTLVAAELTQQLPSESRVLFLANRNELCIQPLAVFASQLGFVPALEKAEVTAPLSARVVIGSVQTLSRQKRLERFDPGHFTHIIADECHYSIAPSWKRIFDYFSGAKRLGITATPFRADAKPLTPIFQAEAFRLNLFDLVDQGFLVNPDNVFKLSSAISLAQVRLKKTSEGTDYDLEDASQAIAPYFTEIAQELKTKHANRHILAFLPLVATSQRFVSICQQAGINAVHVDGEDPERDAKVRAFKDGTVSLLANASLLSTGIDIPICDATLCLRPTRSTTLYQQIVGRSTRVLPGVIDDCRSSDERLAAIKASAKPDSVILDPMWLSDDHALVTPSFLIADTLEEAVQIQTRTKQSYSLRTLQAQIQAEEAIRRRLEAAARFRTGRLDYKYFAAETGEHKLFNYEPIFPKERRVPTPFSLALIAKAGIETSNVTSQGLADQILLAIGRRRFQGRLEIRSLAPIAEVQGVNEALWQM